MFLHDIRLVNFRNFTQSQFVFKGDRTLIFGDNGRGKSNLLEAVGFLSLAKSPRGARDKEVSTHGCTGFFITGVFSKGTRSFTIAIRYDSSTGKQAYLDGQPLPKLSDLVGTFNTVLFSPEDVDLVLRFPAQRRRILDVLASQSDVSYLSDLQAYYRVLAQRNHLLRNASQMPDIQLLDPWDVQLAELGGRIVDKRIRLIDEIVSPLVNFYQQLSPRHEVLSISYQASETFSSREEICASLLMGLRNHRKKEALVGYTLSGPHRDNLAISINNEDIQKYASKGQLKCILLAWKLAEAVFLERTTGEKPTFLLDDAFSELDPARAEALLTMIPHFGQVVLSSARDRDIPLREQGFEEIRI